MKFLYKFINMVYQKLLNYYPNLLLFLREYYDVIIAIFVIIACLYLNVSLIGSILEGCYWSMAMLKPKKLLKSRSSKYRAAPKSLVSKVSSFFKSNSKPVVAEPGSIKSSFRAISRTTSTLRTNVRNLLYNLLSLTGLTRYYTPATAPLFALLGRTLKYLKWCFWSFNLAMMVWVLYYNTPFLTAKVILMWFWGFIKGIKTLYLDYIYNFINYITEGFKMGFDKVPAHKGAKELTDKFNHINKIAADARYVDEFHSVLSDIKKLEPQWKTGKGQPRWYDMFKDDYKPGSSSWLRSAPSHVSNSIDYWEMAKSALGLTLLTILGAGIIILTFKYWLPIKGFLFLLGSGLKTGTIYCASGIKAGTIYCASGIKAGVLAMISYFSGGGNGEGGGGGASGLTDSAFMARLRKETGLNLDDIKDLKRLAILNDDSMKTPLSSPTSSIDIGWKDQQDNPGTSASGKGKGRDDGLPNPWGTKTPDVELTRPTPPKDNSLGLGFDGEKSPILNQAKHYKDGAGGAGMSNWEAGSQQGSGGTPSPSAGGSQRSLSPSPSVGGSQRSLPNSPSQGGSQHSLPNSPIPESPQPVSPTPIPQPDNPTPAPQGPSGPDNTVPRPQTTNAGARKAPTGFKRLTLPGRWNIPEWTPHNTSNVGSSSRPVWAPLGVSDPANAAGPGGTSNQGIAPLSEETLRRLGTLNNIK
uniref:hypothetical protein n=1 Tax=Phellinidium ferrugineofuscum TaxID=167367 RepID=UPI0023AA312A|nr:hypothetical protein P1Q01_mgp23 [Phellinidium ferrugineofuscum]WCF76803.1 hypothetical protein [Phellinidium ferrugineofuscum]